MVTPLLIGDGIHPSSFLAPKALIFFVENYTLEGLKMSFGGIGNAKNAPSILRRRRRRRVFFLSPVVKAPIFFDRVCPTTTPK
jgi:hypothetical protein